MTLDQPSVCVILTYLLLLNSTHSLNWTPNQSSPLTDSPEADSTCWIGQTAM